jgi:hypothetical protein
VSATAFESDLTLYLQNRPTVEEMERRVSWKSNPTVEKQRPPYIPQRVASMAETVRRSVLKLKPPRARRVASVMSILVALCWGVLAGLVVCVPLGYYYRFWRESNPLRGNLDYTRASVGEINREWDLLQRVQRQNAFLGGLSPANHLEANMRAALLQAGNEVIEGYRNNSDPRIQDFDWPKGAVCFAHLTEMNRNDRAVRGKLALCHGYENLERAEHQAQADFEDAASLTPQSPDPHLGLARLYVYSLKNIGKAMAELHEAQRLGFEPGPREAEEEADGYRFRATAELAEARRYGPKNSAAEKRYLRLAERDFDRARQLYEPIEGFSNVSVALRQVDDDDRARQGLAEELNKKPKPVKRPRRVARRAHWQ